VLGLWGWTWGIANARGCSVRGLLFLGRLFHGKDAWEVFSFGSKIGWGGKMSAKPEARQDFGANQG